MRYANTKPNTLLRKLAAAAMTLATVVLPTAGAAEPKTLLMHYMPWYETPEVSGEWGAHWTGWDKQHNPEQADKYGMPDIYSHYHPLIGPYDSADPHAVECQLQQMKLAGVNGVIADWYGSIDHHDYAPIHNATKVLFEQAGKVGLTFSVCYEDRTVQELVKADKATDDDLAAPIAESFKWAEDNWFNAPHYQRYMGRPLALNFGPIYIKDTEAWNAAFAQLDQRPAFFALHHLWKDINADGGFTWAHNQEFKGTPTADQMVERLANVFRYPSSNPEQVITSALPGFHDIYTTTYHYIPHRGSETLRWHLEAAMQVESPIVQLVTWNDYGEGTMIEPTHEFGYLFLETIQDTRRAEAHTLGNTFAFTQDDLRLPARLFRARKSGEHAQSTLNRIAEMINRGDVRAARRALDTLTR
ncbi:MAG: hypothetical protein AAF297_11020 [Planctomycetota bacterium]